MKASKTVISSAVRKVSTYIAGALKRPLPPHAVESGKQHLLDTLAAMISGSRLQPGKRAVAYARRVGGVKEATVVGTPLKTSCVSAALANGMMAHADETDDSHTRSQSHPGCGVVPAALALGESERSSGKAMLRAIVRRIQLHPEPTGPRRSQIAQRQCAETSHPGAVRGTHANPTTRAEIETKSLDLIAPILGVNRAQRLINAVWNIEKITDVRAFARQLRIA